MAQAAPPPHTGQDVYVPRRALATGVEPLVATARMPGITREGLYKKMKRLGRDLLGNARLTTRYEWQGEESEITGYSDSDWAGCTVTGKSTSGGVIMIGSHFVKGWSRTQNHVTMSSAEAE
mgnify:CR=1 FL=1